LNVIGKIHEQWDHNLWPRIRDGIGESALARVIQILARINSPIEQHFAAALYFSQHDLFHEPIFWMPAERRVFGLRGFGTEICAQPVIGHLRPDFGIIRHFDNEQIKVVVECDGSEFHSTSDAHVRRDNERDSFFQSKGWKVRRFTGSQINGSVSSCTNEVSAMIERQCGAMQQARLATRDLVRKVGGLR